MGIIDRFQVSIISWILNQKKWYKRNCPPSKWNFKISICVAQFGHVCSVLKSYPASWHRHWKYERPQIEFLKFHFQGGQFLLYHFFWLRIHGILTWKRSIIPNVWVLVKIKLNCLYLNRFSQFDCEVLVWANYRPRAVNSEKLLGIVSKHSNFSEDQKIWVLPILL